MLRGFYTAAAGMIAQQRRQEMLSNNIANINTPGYKADQTSLRAFPTMLQQQMGGTEGVAGQKAGQRPIGNLATGVYVQDAVPNFVQGDLQETGIGTDLAILQGSLPVDRKTGKPGSLFYTVETKDGETRYTKNGHFTVDTVNHLVTAEGNIILDEKGNPITVSSENFTVSPDGTILDQGRNAGRIGVSLISNPMDLVKEGDGLFRLTHPGSAAVYTGTGFQIKQGFIERSNVDAEQAMTDMMSAYRSFEANQKVLQAYDRSMEKAVNEVGRI
ncbi:flagellar hook-basal body protein [Fictibacillus sp. S7]|uniref:flagellar hook-basal body protein n=1 Tax=Fictibacillus sp. S7 TaxID=2212476 RepID=UPI0010115AAB|nr:flagellar hook-basal body protein [Fictibacillus sp. S7]RXZ01313.1 flagellar biosynthesis protein FlgC [Fictibacillus sp. S7]